MKQTSRGFEFVCPNCRGRFFHSGTKGVVMCDDQNRKGCKWQGPRDACFVWIEVWTPESKEDYEHAYQCWLDQINKKPLPPENNLPY